jgi:hypothetical protein
VSRASSRQCFAIADTGIKLDCVATDILGASGRAMLDALVAGTTDPELLAELACGKLRKKIPALREALEGRFDALHAVLIGAILAHLDFLDEQIDRLSEAIEEQLHPFAPAVELLRSIPGVETRTAQAIIAEVGTDMRVFPTARQLASWAGQCPGNDQSAGKRPLRTRPQGLQVARPSAQAGRHGRHPHPRQLPASPIPTAAPPDRPRPRTRRRQTHDPLRLLAHAHHRRALPRARRRLLPPPRPPTRQTRRLLAQLEALGHTATLQQAA